MILLIVLYEAIQRSSTPKGENHFSEELVSEEHTVDWFVHILLAI